MFNIIPIKKIGELCNITKLPYSYYQELFFLKRNPYRTFHIKKRKSGQKRKIHVPEYNLSIVQKAINRYIVNGMYVHPCATAYVKGSSPIKNARFHCNAKTMIKIDIQNFFHSFDEYDLFELFRKYNFNKLIAFQLSRLCIFVNPEEFENFCFEPRINEGYIYPSLLKGSKYSYMPQGAITSPALSNALMIEYDKKIERLANEFSVRYTRYSDDIFLTSIHKLPEKDTLILLSEVKKCLNGKFFINNEKTKIIHNGQRMIVTGLLVNNTNPQLLKEYKNNMRLQIHYINKNGIIEQANKMRCDPYGYYNHIKGKLLWIQSIEPDFAVKLKSQFDNNKIEDLLKNL